MTNQIDKPRSPMEEFQDNLKKQLRDDIARLLPDEAVKEMIAKVVHDEFFAVRLIDDPTDTSWHNKRKIPQGTKFQDMVFDAAKPILQRLANEWAVKNADVIADHWRKVTDAGLMQYVEKLQAEMATRALRDQMNDWHVHMNQQRANQGLPAIPMPPY